MYCVRVREYEYSYEYSFRTSELQNCLLEVSRSRGPLIIVYLGTSTVGQAQKRYKKIYIINIKIKIIRYTNIPVPGYDINIIYLFILVYRNKKSQQDFVSRCLSLAFLLLALLFLSPHTFGKGDFCP